MNNFLNAILVILLLTTSQFILAVDKAPKGWSKGGKNTENFIVGTDEELGYKSTQSAFIVSNSGNLNGLGTLSQTADASEFLNQRVKLTVFLKTEMVTGWSGAWFRVDGSGTGSNVVLSMDNMRSRPITGTSDWNEYSLVLDVPAHAVRIHYGAILFGGGKIWIDELSLEVVDLNTPITATYFGISEPRNLSFENN
jgi:hypothetical protein